MIYLKALRASLKLSLPLFAIGFAAMGWWGYATLFTAVWLCYLRST